MSSRAAFPGAVFGARRIAVSVRDERTRRGRAPA